MGGLCSEASDTTQNDVQEIKTRKLQEQRRQSMDGNSILMDDVFRGAADENKKEFC